MTDKPKKTKAKESAHIRTVRKKLEKQLAEDDKQIHPEALKTMSFLIHRQIERNQAERINLNEKEIKLFDSNQHSAKTESAFVNQLLNELKHSSQEKKTKKLYGRIKTLDDNTHK